MSREDDLYEHYRITVDKKQSPLRVDKFLMDRLQKTSRNRIQNAIKAGAVKVNKEEVKPNYKVRPGDLITIVFDRPSREQREVIPENIPLDIIYEDDHLLIVNKPAGMVVHPGVGNRTGTLVNGLMYHFRETEFPVMPGNLSNRPGLVHRIDKDTSGLLVIAKTEMAMANLARQFFDHTIERAYRALVWGTFEETAGTINLPISRHPSYRKKMWADPDREIGKKAITHFKVLEDMYYVSLIECHLETGRTHQIRVHFSAFRHPVFSDSKYGGDKIVKGTVFSKYKQFVVNCFKIMPRQALHAFSLGFIHPASKEKIYFEAPLPEDFSNVLEKWRGYFQSKK